MTRAARIRAWLLTQDGPRSGPQIRAALGDDPLTGFTIGSMARDGYLVRTGKYRGFLYSVGRDACIKPALPKTEARQRRTAREVARRRAKGHVSRADYLAKLTAERAEREAASKARIADKRAARLKAKRAAEWKPKPRPKPAPAPRVVAPPKPLPPPKPAPIAAQTVEEWLAAGGKTEVLPPCAWSTPLRTAP